MRSNDGCLRVGAMVALVYAVIMFLIALALIGIGPFTNKNVEYTDFRSNILVVASLVLGCMGLFAAYMLWDPRRPQKPSK